MQGIVYNALGQPLSWTWAFADASTTTSLAALRSHDTAGQLRTSEFASFTPNNLGQLSAITQGLYQRNASGAWVAESVPHSATHDALGRLTSFSAAGSSIEFKRSQTYAWDNNGNRTLSTFSEDGALRSSSAAVFATSSNRLLTLAGLPQTLNAAGEHLQLGSLALAYDNAGRLSRTTQAEPVIEGRGAHKPFMPYAPASHTYNGLNQRVLRENPQGQTVYVYGSEGHNVLGEYQPAASTAIRWSNGFNTEHVWLPTAAGPMPIATVINGEHFAVHADHLNTPRRLTDRNGISRWQWAYSGFGEVGPQSLSTATLPEVRFNLRFPGQVDDANGLFYNWNRFYHPGTGRYTKADPIGLEGGWNRFGYGSGNALSHVDPEGLQQRAPPPRPNPNLISNAQAHNLVTQIQQINPQFRYPSVMSSPGQGGYSSQDVQFLQTVLQRARPGGTIWPRTPQEMDQYLRTPGICRPDLRGTPGRSKIVWQPSDSVRITFEQHPYHPTAPSFHSGPHWHLDLPGVRHQTFVPTESMP